MRSILLLVVLSLALGGAMGALAQEPPAPAPPQDPAPAADRALAPPAPVPMRVITGRTTPFTIQVPAEWQVDIYDNPEDRPFSRALLQGGPNSATVTPTDNISLWWYEGPASPLLGVASVHRLQTTGSWDLKTLYTGLRPAALPPGTEVAALQLGSYAGLAVWATIEDVFLGGVIVIPQDHVAYVAAMIGPSLPMAAQWPKLVAAMSFLNAPDLQPQELADIIPPEPVPTETDETEPAP